MSTATAKLGGSRDYSRVTKLRTYHARSLPFYSALLAHSPPGGIRGEEGAASLSREQGAARNSVTNWWKSSNSRKMLMSDCRMVSQPF